MSLAGPADTDRAGQRLAGVLAAAPGGAVITLAGELGAGKTALVRAIIQALGHAGPVVSPSYTLIEPYDLGDRRVHHLDLYRLGDPEELEFLGIRDLDADRDLVFIEWAERGRGFLPPTDLAITMEYAEPGRRLVLAPASDSGMALVSAFAAAETASGTN